MICRDRVVPVIVSALGVSISKIVSQGVGPFYSGAAAGCMPIHEACLSAKFGMATFTALRTGKPATHTPHTMLGRRFLQLSPNLLFSPFSIVLRSFGIMGCNF